MQPYGMISAAFALFGSPLDEWTGFCMEAKTHDIYQRSSSSTRPHRTKQALDKSQAKASNILLPCYAR
jgi:hypothetical protein